MGDCSVDKGTLSKITNNHLVREFSCFDYSAQSSPTTHQNDKSVTTSTLSPAKGFPPEDVANRMLT